MSIGWQRKSGLNSFFFIPPSPFYLELLQIPYLKISQIHPTSLQCSCPAPVETRIVTHLRFCNNLLRLPQPPALPPSSPHFAMKPEGSVWCHCHCCRPLYHETAKLWLWQPLQTLDTFFLVCIGCSKKTELLPVLKNFFFFLASVPKLILFPLPFLPSSLATFDLANLYFITRVLV